MFESLNEKLEGAFKSLKGEGSLTELNIATSIKEIRRALVGADVNYKIAKEFTDKVKDQAMGEKNVLKAVKPGELMVKIVMDELIDLMGGTSEGIFCPEILLSFSFQVSKVQVRRLSQESWHYT